MTTGQKDHLELPFAQGDRVSFRTVHYEGTGRVVGMTPYMGYRNYGVVIEYETLKLIALDASNPYLGFKCLVVTLYEGVDAALGFDTPPCVVRLQQ